jgi:hypothetical protein
MKYSLLRYLKERRLRRCFEPVREKLQAELSLFLKQPCCLVPAMGKGGYDRLYYVDVEGQRLAIMRVKNSLEDSAIVNTDRDIRLALRADARLDYEWNAYTILSQKELSPKPLWRTAEAIVSTYHPFKRASEILKADEHQVWDLLPRLFSLVRRIHEEKIVHMDLNLGNILIDPLSRCAMAIDFEYEPAKILTFEQACLCDYCRLVSDLLRPRRGGSVLRKEMNRFVSLLQQELPHEVQQADREALRRQFPRKFLLQAEEVLQLFDARKS